MPFEDVSLLVVGCGSIGTRHARNLHALGVRRLCLHDPDRDRMERLAGELGARAAESIEGALAEGPDAVLVCTPSVSHLQIAADALAARAHVFVEKPLAASVDGVVDFVDRAQASGRTVMVGYNLRFHPVLRRIESWLASAPPALSARLHIGEWLPGRHAYEDYRVGYGARRELGGGALLDAIHELDYAYWLFGWPQRLVAMGGHVSDLEIDTDDLAEILLGYDDGRVVSIHLDYLQRPRARTCTVVGNGWSIQADLNGRSAALEPPDDGEPARFEAATRVDDDYVAELRHFLECVTGAAPPLVDGREGAASLMLAELARRSIDSGQIITLPPTLDDALRSVRAT